MVFKDSNSCSVVVADNLITCLEQRYVDCRSRSSHGHKNESRPQGKRDLVEVWCVGSHWLRPGHAHYALAPPWPWRCKFDPRTDHSKGAIHPHNCPLGGGLLTLDLELLTAICNKSTDGVALCWRKRLLTENGQMLLEACQFFTRFRQTRSKIKNDK